MNEIVYSGLTLFVSTLPLWFLSSELTNFTPVLTGQWFLQRKTAPDSLIFSMLDDDVSKY